MRSSKPTVATGRTNRWSLLAAAAIISKQVTATPCVAYDGTGDVAYVFGAPYGDLSLGSDLSDPSAFVSLTNKTGRPDFSGTNTQCFVNQFTNGLYVVGATENSTNSVYIYDFVGQSWSTQRISSELDPSTYTAILDHDTNVLYAYFNGTINALAFDQEKAASTSETISWQLNASRNTVPFDMNVSYQPVMGASNNHIQFLNTPAATEGSAYIFIIHYAYWQPEPQNFGALPNAYGQTATILSNSSAAPTSFAFIPESGNATYVVNTKTNTTTSYPGPTVPDQSAKYGASTTSLLQVSSDGSLAYFDFAGDNSTWTTIDVSSFNQTSKNTNASLTASATTALAAGPNNAAPSTLIGGATDSPASLATLSAFILPLLVALTIAST